MAVVRERSCCEFPHRVSGRVCEKGFEEEVMEVSGDESDNWCEASVCVLAHVLLCFCSEFSCGRCV